MVQLQDWMQNSITPWQHPTVLPSFSAFSHADGARSFAGLVTCSNILRLYLAGTGQGDSTLAQSISRSSDTKEVLGGPFIDVCLFHTRKFFRISKIL
jgi:hypothetical protein